MRRLCYSLALITLVVTNHLLSQPSLDFRRITYEESIVTLYYQLRCGNDIRYDVTKDNFTVLENGKTINDLEVWCEPGDARCCISAALLIDRSASMAGVGIQTANDGAKAFFDAMDGNCDEATLMTFTSQVYVNVFMTNDKILLKKSLDLLTTGGNSAVWDATAFAITELVSNGTMDCKAVILFTNGNDQGSCHSIDDLIGLAQLNKMRIFVIGVGENINQSYLQQIATDTGGKFYLAPSPSQLAAVYREIQTMIATFITECTITYLFSPSADSTRTIDLTLKNLPGCPGTVTRTRVLHTILDTTTTPVNIALGTTTVEGGTLAKIPLMIIIPMMDFIPPANCFVLCDTQCVKLECIEAGEYKGAITFDYRPGGYWINFPEATGLRPSTILAKFVFRTNDLPFNTICPVKLYNWTFYSEKYSPTLSHGLINVLRSTPKVSCKHISSPFRLRWDAVIRDYVPNPFQVAFDFLNCGTKTASSPFATISFDTTKLSLSSPDVYTQPCIPFAVSPTGFTHAEWRLRAKPAMRDDTVSISCTATFDNNPSVRCETKIIIPKAILTEVKEATAPGSFALEQNYPNPFSSSTTIRLVMRDWRLESTAHNTLIPNPRSLISFKVFDLFGREVLDLSDEARNNSQLRILNSQLPGAGMYFYRLTVGTMVQTRMMALLR